MKAGSAALGCLMALSAAMSTNAQASQRPFRSEPIALRMMQDFGRCVVRQDRSRAERVLAMDFSTPAYKREIRALADSENGCTWVSVSQMRFSTLLFAGSLAEALMSQYQASLPDRLVWREGDPVLEARSESEAAALCTAHAVPNEVANLFATQAGSDDEAAALNSIMPHLTDCVRAGQQLRVNREGLRVLLSLAAYRIVNAGMTAGVN
jgi:hypothetical protein